MWGIVIDHAFILLCQNLEQDGEPGCLESIVIKSLSRLSVLSIEQLLGRMQIRIEE